MVPDLTRGRLTQQTPCHLDPDLAKESRRRSCPTGWRGSLGQESAAQGHLENQGVGSGDLFLFFGLFREAIKRDTDTWAFQGKPFHALFGWLQIEEALSVQGDPARVLARHPWLAEHPHLHGDWTGHNTIYVARERLAWGELDLPGWGLLPSPVRLTDQDATGPSTWQVPPWLDPTCGGTGMTYHPPARWLGSGRLKAAGRGQEFVAQVGDRRDAMSWVAEVLRV